MKHMLALLAALLLGPLAALQAAEASSKKPNFLWFVVDDMSANFSCYGEKLIQTPHVDRLAREARKLTFFHATLKPSEPPAFV